MRDGLRSLRVLAVWVWAAGCGNADGAGAPIDGVDAAPAHDAGAPRDATGPDPVHDAGARRAPELGSCWEGRWCWIEGASVQALDGASPDTVHAVDEGGRLWRWDGATWDSVAGLERRRVRRVYVAAADDLWVVAEHADEPGFFVDRFDGLTWSTLRGDVDPRFLEGHGADNVWVRERETLAWLRFDGRGWRAVEEPDPLRLEVPYDGLYRKLLPGPAPEAYAIAVTRIDPRAPAPQPREVVVMRFDGTRWAPMGALGTGWAELAWTDDEPRVVEHYDDGSAELRFDGDRWVRERWVPFGAAADAYWLSGSGRGVARVPSGSQCLDVLPVGDEVFCTTLAYGGVRGRTVAHGGVDGRWTETLLPVATRPLAPELFAGLAPGYWAGSAWRSWGDAPANVLRIRRGEASGSDGALERVDAARVTPVLDADGRPLAAVHLDGTTRELPWVAAGDLYRVDGARAERVTMPPELEWARVHAVAAEPAGRAWALAADLERELVLRVEGDTVWVDHEVSLDLGSGEHVAPHDLAVGPDGDVWVLASVGWRTGYGLLLHRSAGARGEASWRTVRLWDEAFTARQVVYFRGALYISGVAGAWSTVVGAWIGGTSVVRVPLGLLAGDEVAGPASDFVLGRAPEVLADAQVFSTESDFAFDFSDPELWVGESGVWLTTEDAARRFVEPR